MADSPALDILVLAGGISHEREISLRSGRRVTDYMLARGHRVTMREPDSTLLPFLRDNRPDVIWPALHGASGENGSLRALLELSEVPFVGSLAGPAALAWSKPTAKTIVRGAGVHTPASVSLPKETFRELGADSVLTAIGEGLRFPLVVKPAMGGSAQGVNFVDTSEDLPRAMVEAYTYCDIALIEEKIFGVEVSVAILDTGEGPEALPCVEIEPLGGTYSFDARYNAGETCFYIPARLDPQVQDTLARHTIIVHEALELRHVSRIDWIVDEDGVPWFLEANVLPGLTETSLVPQAILASGQDLGTVYTALAKTAISSGRANVSRET